MDNALIRKLERFAPLSTDDKRLLDDIVEPRRAVDGGRVLVAEGQPSETVRLIVDGLACRHKNLGDGRRQIVAYLIPGEFGDFNVSILKAVDHSIATLSPCTVIDIPRRRILDMTSRPGLTRVLWWVTLVDEGSLRGWLLDIGQRLAVERPAHLFCELFARMQSIGLTKGCSSPCPSSRTTSSTRWGCRWSTSSIPAASTRTTATAQIGGSARGAGAAGREPARFDQRRIGSPRQVMKRPLPTDR